MQTNYNKNDEITNTSFLIIYLLTFFVLYAIIHLYFEREVVSIMESDDSECNTQHNYVNITFEAYLRVCYKIRGHAFLRLKKALI